MTTTDVRDMTENELRDALSWNESLAEHYDDTYNSDGYHACQKSIQRIQTELARRTRR
ncbi:hypothetical protein G6L37_07370 [Agrobacterium rubi]|nr:hypothetical protein [Agrobacterium rubi]NTF25187.1 hypothetical protein [Agrobacterium rubi]